MTQQIIQQPLVALSLGGGGAKTFAHLGVIDCLRKNNIPIDYLTTCSAASIIGFLVSIGITSTEIIKEYKRKRKWLRIFKGLVFKQALKKFLKEKNITDIKQARIPIAIVTVDLKTGKEVIFEQGDPLLVPLASSAYPGIWQPIKYRGYYLIDGGVLNPDPADVARKKVGPNGRVISVTVRMEFKQEKPGSRLNVILKSLYLSPFKYRDQIIKENSDIIIIPINDLRISFKDWKETFFGYFSNSRIEEYYQKGYHEAQKQIPNIKKLLLTN